MTSTEKIANAQKRIDELQRLIKYWNNPSDENSDIANISLKVSNKVS